MNNMIIASGLVTEPIFVVSAKDKNYFKFKLKVERLSGAADEFICIANEEIAQEIKAESKIKIYGEIRTKNITFGDKTRLIVYVLVNSLTKYESGDENHVMLKGFICKPPIIRKTPLTKIDIAEVMLAVNRAENNVDYIPVILWNQSALNLEPYGVGTKLLISGRFQSRKYEKKHEDGSSEIKTAYEVSAFKVDELMKRI